MAGWESLQLREHDRHRPFALLSPGFEQPLGAAPTVPWWTVEATVDELPARLGVLGPGGFAGVRVAGPRLVLRTGTERVARRRVAIAPGDRLACTMTGPRFAAWRHDGERWRCLLVADADPGGQDLRRPELLAEHSFVAEQASDVRCGTFGQLGVRDPHLVQAPDGTPFTADGRHWLTLTAAGPGFFPTAHWVVCSLALPDPATLRVEAHLFSRRDGLVVGDHAGQLIVDGGAVHLVVSSWGDFDGDGVRTLAAAGGRELLTGVQVLDPRPLALPTELSTWDPGLTRVGERWHVSYVESPSQRPFTFRPALAVGEPGGPPAGPFRLAGADLTRAHTEGPVLARVDEQWLLLAGDGTNREFPVYDLAMQQLGRLDATFGSNIPHPQVVAGEDGRTWLVTFDGTPWDKRRTGYGSHGDLVVLGEAS